MNKLFEDVDRIVKANDYLNSDEPSNYRKEQMWIDEDTPVKTPLQKPTIKKSIPICRPAQWHC
jgi:hypothetical protein